MKNISKFTKAIRFIFEDISIIASFIPVVSSNIASWIIVNSRCVDGLSNGNRLFSANSIVNKIIDNIKMKKLTTISVFNFKKLNIDNKSIFQLDKTTKNNINNIVTGSTIAKTNDSLDAHNPQK